MPKGFKKVRSVDLRKVRVLRMPIAACAAACGTDQQCFQTDCKPSCISSGRIRLSEIRAVTKPVSNVATFVVQLRTRPSLPSLQCYITKKMSTQILAVQWGAAPDLHGQESTVRSSIGDMLCFAEEIPDSTLYIATRLQQERPWRMPWRMPRCQASSISSQRALRATSR